ncbi:class I tRNA ligase family protein [Mesorhizobium sp.]|uniref:class I tRNA ligase family protein n=1 Tax=Mesorhizobium sp. TaxID=1871066 RepID=UPI000FE8857A|nr:class I tRNA ligase family protein [Mesorhizobium sp.]RWK47477.1 MAG: hypothetical protein EOR48_32115 [Mesorhizobium sp.]
MPSHPLTLISVPPPTPNGDLHVGHLSGPYLGADVLARYNRLRSRSTVSAFSSDKNQSYVVTTAERLQADPHVLANESHEGFRQTLELAEIRFDLLGMPDRSYYDYVTRHFASLKQSGALTLKKADFLFHRPSGRYLFESYAQGRCNMCLSGTKGNICENCGHPNDPLRLLDVQATGYPPDEDALEVRSVPTLVLALENYRTRIERHLASLQAPMRPELATFCKDLLSGPLPDLPVTFMSDWGISAASLGLPGAVINVWAEMQPGHVYWLTEAWKNSPDFDQVLAEKQVEYIQFLGFDNSYFYAFAHLALAFAAQDAGLFSPLPSAFITNEFYQLENRKFSTSQGHLIWARDLLSQEAYDDVRFYLCWSNPEHQKANFTSADMQAVVDRYFRRPISTILDRLETGSANLGCVTSEPEASVALAADMARRRLEGAYCTSSFSLRRAAQTLVDLLDWCAQLAELAESGQARAKANFKAGLDVTVLGLAPIAPAVASRLWRIAGHTEPMSWNAEADFVADLPRLTAAG